MVPAAPVQGDGPPQQRQISVRRFVLVRPVVTAEQVIEYIKAHPGGCPRYMSKDDKKNRLLYMRMFHEVYHKHRGQIRTEWKVIGDGRGQPCQQLHYWWIG